MSKILIAIPTFENIMPETFKSIYDLDPCGNELSFEFVKGYDCAKGIRWWVRLHIYGGLRYDNPTRRIAYVTYDNGSELSEDLYFCSQAKANGYNIFVDARARCGHATRYFQFE